MRFGSIIVIVNLINIDWVMPICLPSGELLIKNFAGEIAEVAGWGIYDIREYFNNFVNMRRSIEEFSLYEIGSCFCYELQWN